MTEATSSSEAAMILQPHHIKRIVEAFKLDEQRSVDLERARSQTFNAIQSGQIEKLQKEAAELAKSEPDTPVEQQQEKR